MTFASLRLAEPLLAALSAEGYSTPTPIQARAIPPILAGKDLLGCAQTGTGKTAAFALPLLQRVMVDSPHRPAVEPHKKRLTRALILSPTRELASQIGQSIRTYGGQTGVRYAVIFGGVGQTPQVQSLRSGVDVLIATPGRLLDLMNQGHVELSHIEFFVLDEADRMLDMGFIHDIRKVVAKLPAKRQNLMFSATMPTEIRQLANGILQHPEYIEVAPVSSTAELIEQSVYHVRKENKPALLAHLFDALPMARSLVFMRTKHGADKLVKKLRGGGIHAEAIHGNKTQNARQRSLGNFKSGKIPMLVATDIAARGIDVDGVTHVINYDIPNEPETYVHRIGRTGRAGATGEAIAFCDDGDERSFLRDIERLIKKRISIRDDHPTYAQNHKLAALPSRHEQSFDADRDDRRLDRRPAKPHKVAVAHKQGQGVRIAHSHDAVRSGHSGGHRGGHPSGHEVKPAHDTHTNRPANKSAGPKHGHRPPDPRAAHQPATRSSNHPLTARRVHAHAPRPSHAGHGGAHSGHGGGHRKGPSGRGAHHRSRRDG